MTDVHSPSVRSKNMRAVRSKNTRPELIIRKIMHAAGFRFRLHLSTLPGRPDIVFPKYRAVILVNGCFWHGHDCHLFKLPSTRKDFWEKKIKKNQINDDESFKALKELGWRVAIVWECAIRNNRNDNYEKIKLKLTEWLKSSDVSTLDIRL